MLSIVKWVLNWLVLNATAKVYSSLIPVGRRLGGKDVPEVNDLYIVLDVRAGGRIILLGYFQTT